MSGAATAAAERISVAGKRAASGSSRSSAHRARSMATV